MGNAPGGERLRMLGVEAQRPVEVLDRAGLPVSNHTIVGMKLWSCEKGVRQVVSGALGLRPVARGADDQSSSASCSHAGMSRAASRTRQTSTSASRPAWKTRYGTPLTTHERRPGRSSSRAQRGEPLAGCSPMRRRASSSASIKASATAGRASARQCSTASSTSRRARSRRTMGFPVTPDGLRGPDREAGRSSPHRR